MGTGVPLGGGLLPRPGQVVPVDDFFFLPAIFQGTHFGPPFQPRRAGKRPVSQALGLDH